MILSDGYWLGETFWIFFIDPLKIVAIQNALTSFITLFVQLALTGAPSSSHIYVFTDAIAKDIDLKDTIIALIRTTKSTVNTHTDGTNDALFTRLFSDFNLKC